MLTSLATSAATLLCIHVLLRGPPNLLPYRPLPGQSLPCLSELEKRYGEIDSFPFSDLNWGWLLLTPVWYVVLRPLAALVYPDPGDAGLVVTPMEDLWLCTAALAALLTHYLVRPRMLKQRLMHRYDEYRFYRKLKHGRLEPWLRNVAAVALGLAIVLGSYLFLTTYTVFANDRIVIKHGYKQTRSYSYSEISAIRAADRPRREDGETAERDGYKIEFSDGTLWSMGDAIQSVDPCDGYPIFAFVAERSGQPITGPDLRDGSAGCR